MPAKLAIKRVYEKPAKGDGVRILVDRLWPRGVSKQKAAVDLWLKDIAPSADLRKWFGHDPERWTEFRRRYRAELKANKDAVKALRAELKVPRVTLLYAAHDADHNNARVLAEYLGGRRG
ncbi:MAG TPA: DUF488 domain-containing protein [Xanthobacteraceae bacterium]|jgi:uncharacterized protein YeaO (DUF488 family)|nr:DUF488 domain-containing protein [Xanthobacteraceae bacterium]